MKTSQQYRSLPLCSQCIKHEIGGWLNENQDELKKDTKLKIRKELKSISLKGGECIVCNKKTVSEDTAEKILDVLEENEEQREIIGNFTRSFCFVE